MKIALLISVSLFATPVLAADTTPAAGTPAAAKEKKICHTQEPALGSNIVRRVCKTAAEWAKDQPVQTPGQKMDMEHFRDTASQYANPR